MAPRKGWTNHDLAWKVAYCNISELLGSISRAPNRINMVTTFRIHCIVSTFQLTLSCIIQKAIRTLTVAWYTLLELTVMTCTAAWYTCTHSRTLAGKTQHHMTDHLSTKRFAQLKYLPWMKDNYIKGPRSLEILMFVSLQKDTKLCCDMTKLDCTGWNKKKFTLVGLYVW